MLVWFQMEALWFPYWSLEFQIENFAILNNFALLECRDITLWLVHCTQLECPTSSILRSTGRWWLSSSARYLFSKIRLKMNQRNLEFHTYPAQLLETGTICSRFLNRWLIRNSRHHYIHKSPMIPFSSWSMEKRILSHSQMLYSRVVKCWLFFHVVGLGGLLEAR